MGVVSHAINLFTAIASNYSVPPATLDPAPYPEWAHHHWSVTESQCRPHLLCHCMACRVWLSHDRAKQSSMMDYAMEYIEHGIKVSSNLIAM